VGVPSPHFMQLRAGLDNSVHGRVIVMMGAGAPIPSRARSAAAPGGKPPRRIDYLLIPKKEILLAYPYLPKRDPARRRTDIPASAGRGDIVNMFIRRIPGFI
jgi:hypothetical protein